MQTDTQEVVQIEVKQPEFKIELVNSNVPITTSREVLNRFNAKFVSDTFISAGIPISTLGYKYLNGAIKAISLNPDLIDSITKGLYPTVAKELNTTPLRVERAIRHAIETGWTRGKMRKALNDIVGKEIYSQYDKPTNKEFIALVFERMYIQIN